jgi:hypothetical protein
LHLAHHSDSTVNRKNTRLNQMEDANEDNEKSGVAVACRLRYRDADGIIC